MSVHVSILGMFINAFLASEMMAGTTFPRNQPDLAAQIKDFISTVGVFLSFFLTFFPALTE